MAKGEDIPKTSPTEIEKLIEQIRETNLEPGAKEKVERLLRTAIVLVNLLQRKNMSIKKLRDMIFGRRTEKREGSKAGSSQKSDDEERERPGVVESDGRRARGAYTGARVVNCGHEQYKAGGRCPDPLCGGRLYDLKAPKVLLQFTGQPLIAATQFEREVLRCAKCQERYTAPLPEGIKDERFDATADATIALQNCVARSEAEPLHNS
jgi:hypothetical protein